MQSLRSIRVTPEHWACLAVLLVAGISGRTAWAAPAPLPPELKACTLEKDDQARLTCYDQAMTRLTTGPGESYGLSAEQMRKATPQSAPEKAKTTALSSTVTTATVQADGRQLIRLANGQTWLQSDAYDVIQVRSGDSVTIKPGLLGSYFLYTSSGAATRVTRSK
ncbi:MAG TPA: hypothetical protein VGF89_08870 [Steroidobacteraceae bacterium]|jgi:uncharacterized cupin superfamily protein